MKAVLIEFSLTTRIIVSDDFDIDNIGENEYAQIRDKAIPEFHIKLENDGVGDLLASVENDTEMPYDKDSTFDNLTTYKPKL